MVCPAAAVFAWRRAVVASIALSVFARPSSADELSQSRTEFGAIPFAGGDSDVGIGVGQLSAITRYEPGYTPWRWRIETAAYASFKPRQVPFQDYFLNLTLPDLVPRVLRLELTPSYTRETTLRYYGLGNASPGSNDLGELEYTRTHPTFWARTRLTLVDGLLYLRLGMSLTYNGIAVPAGTRLAHDMASPDPERRRLLGDARDHGVMIFEDSVVYDTRDDEVNPTRGAWDAITFRGSPGGTAGFPYQYVVLNGTLRAYVPLSRSRVTLAVRGVADLLLGDPPFYQLARYEDTSAIGGANGVRGVPAGRYYGKVKVFGTVELRTEFAQLQVFDHPIHLGVAAFVDAGRVWADTRAHPELDGTGLGLKYGLGLGPRARVGTHFVVRGDLAFSPDADPIGVYFTAGETF